MVKLLECEYCERLYSSHSIGIHMPKCSANPNFVMNDTTNYNKTDNNGKKKKKIKRGKSVDSRRPRTKCLTYRRESNVRDPRVSMVNIRICFVCGESFSLSTLSEHENHCLEEWKKEVKSLPSRFTCRTPKGLDIPSIDGTVDVPRMNAHAIVQSGKAREVRCTRCNTTIPLETAKHHKCSRFEPDIQFYY